jgi:hypothetical protein
MYYFFSVKFLNEAMAEKKEYMNRMPPLDISGMRHSHSLLAFGAAQPGNFIERAQKQLEDDVFGVGWLSFERAYGWIYRRELLLSLNLCFIPNNLENVLSSIGPEP